MIFLPAAVVTERIRGAHQYMSAPIMMLFPGNHPTIFFLGQGIKIILLILIFVIYVNFFSIVHLAFFFLLMQIFLLSFVTHTHANFCKINFMIKVASFTLFILCFEYCFHVLILGPWVEVFVNIVPT